MAKRVKLKGTIGKLFEDASLLFWRILTIVVSVLTLFIIGRSVISIIRSQHHINILERERTEYLNRIAEDSIMLNNLKDDQYLEKFARERYNMQRKNERVYIIER